MALAESHAHESKFDDLTDFLREHIRTGLLSPGQRLIEADVARERGVSRTKVRQALQHLAGEGLVALEANRGASVRRFDATHLSEIYEVREALEAIAARRLAERLDDETRAGIRLVQADLDHAEEEGEGERYAVANERLHQFIVDHCGNDYIRSALSPLWIPAFRLSLQRAFSQEYMRRSNASHRLITAAILAGDGAVAEATMRSHIGKSRSLIHSPTERWY